jgi:hypothetical protein
VAGVGFIVSSAERFWLRLGNHNHAEGIPSGQSSIIANGIPFQSDPKDSFGKDSLGKESYGSGQSKNYGAIVPKSPHQRHVSLNDPFLTVDKLNDSEEGKNGGIHRFSPENAVPAV